MRATRLCGPAATAATVALVVLGGAAAASRASAVARPRGQVPHWHVVDAIPDTATATYDLFAVTAPGPRDGWAFGRESSSNGQGLQFSAVLRHWDGHSWRPALLPARVAARWNAVAPVQAGSSSARNVWVFPLGAWARWNGERWHAGPLPLPRGYVGSVRITGTDVLSRSDVWVVGNLTVASIIPYVAHFNGRRWSFRLLRSPDTMVAVSGSGPDNVWIAGNSGTNLLRRWDGRRWRPVPMPAGLAGPTTFGGLVVQSPDSAWITGLVPGAAGPSAVGGAWHWNGRRWRLYRLAASCALSPAAPDGHGGLWAGFAYPCAHARLWHRAHGRWTSTAMPDDGPYAYLNQLTAVPGTAAMLAAGAAYAPTLSAVVLQDGHLP